METKSSIRDKRARGIGLVNAFHDVCLCRKIDIKLFLLGNTLYLFCYKRLKKYFKVLLPFGNIPLIDVVAIIP